MLYRLDEVLGEAKFFGDHCAKLQSHVLLLVDLFGTYMRRFS